MKCVACHKNGIIDDTFELLAVTMCRDICFPL